jgi:hypothetical protein
MATTVQVNDILLINAVTQCQAQIGLNGYFFQVTTIGAAPATDLDVCTYFSTTFSGVYIPILPGSASYYGAMVRILNRVPKPAFVATNNGAGIGTVAGAALPKQTCGLITKRTPIAGRHGRGRTYVPFPASLDDTGAGGPGGGYITRVTALASAIIVPVTVTAGGRSCSLIPVLWDRKAAVPFAITAFTVSARWATQRRRGDFGRPNIPPF